ncbi:MAG: hypothetical protein ACRCX8_19500 [Sarcina sp.]
MAFGIDKDKLTQKLDKNTNKKSLSYVNKETVTFSMSTRLMEDIDRFCKGKKITRTEYFERYLLKYYDAKEERMLFDTEKRLSDKRKTINMRLDAGLAEALKTLCLEKNKTAGAIMEEIIHEEES